MQAPTEQCFASSSTSTHRASLMGLPVEIRVEIYGYLNHIVHLHLDSVKNKDDSRSLKRRICQAPDPVRPHTCAAPEFSICHHPTEFCHALPISLHPIAIRQTCRLIHTEIHSFFGPVEFAITASPFKLAKVLLPSQYAAVPSIDLARIVHVTLNGWSTRDGPASDQFPECLCALPSLRSVTWQKERYWFNPRMEIRTNNLKAQWRQEWGVDKLEQFLKGRVTIEFEQWTVLQTEIDGWTYNKGLFVFRGVVWGGSDREGKESEEEYTIEWRKDIVFGSYKSLPPHGHCISDSWFEAIG